MLLNPLVAYFLDLTWLKRNSCYMYYVIVFLPQEGFLLGEVESHISEHISDSQICNEKTETIISKLTCYHIR